MPQVHATMSTFSLTVNRLISKCLIPGICNLPSPGQCNKTHAHKQAEGKGPKSRPILHTLDNSNAVRVIRGVGTQGADG